MSDDKIKISDMGYSMSSGNAPSPVFGEEEPITSMDDYVKAIAHNGEVIPIKRADYIKYHQMGNLLNLTVIDPITKKVASYSSIGSLIKVDEADEEDISIPYTTNFDFAGNPVNPVAFNKLSESKISVEVKKKEISKEGKTLISIDNIINLLSNPSAYKNGLIIETSNIDKLICCKLCQPHQFDEIFTTFVNPPESPLLRNYLDILGSLINEELKKSDEVSNIDDLEKLAYERSDYVGKTFETVLSEARDYKDYQRYLLTKEDKTIITESEKKYVDTLCSIIEKEGTYTIFKRKKNKINITLEGLIEQSKLFYLSDTVDCINENSEFSATIFKYTDEHISKFIENIDNTDLPLKIIMTQELINQNYSIKSSKKDPSVKLFVCDKFYNKILFIITQNTLSKWNKKLDKMIRNLDKYSLSSLNIFPYNIENTNI